MARKKQEVGKATMTLSVNLRKAKQKRKPGGGIPFTKLGGSNPPPNPWPKGVSGNPNGRPKGSGNKKLSVAYSATLTQVVPDRMFSSVMFAPFAHLRGMGFTFADLIALGQACSAAAGNTPAAKEIREVTEGKITEEMVLTTKDADGNPMPMGAQPSTLQINFVDPGHKKKKE